MPRSSQWVWMVALMCACMQGLAFAQTIEMPLRGKRVAVYFSKRHFSFDDNYRIPLSQFIKSDAGDADALIEDIKVQTLVALGSLFAQQLAGPTQADSVYFLNEKPELAQTFLGNYDSESHALQPLGAAFEGTDYILVVSPFILGSYKTSSVYSRSNRIITEQVVVKTARVRVELMSPRTGERMHVFETCIDERKTKVPQVQFEFHMQASRTGQFLARLFSLVVDNMNAGRQGNCNDGQ